MLFRSLALPHGAYPKNVAWARTGTAKGVTYRHDAILMVAGGASASPFARAFDPTRVPRIQALERELRYWLDWFDKNPGERFVSDGDPDVVTVPIGSRDRLRPDVSKRLRVVER